MFELRLRIGRLQFQEVAKPMRENAKVKSHSVVANGLEGVHRVLCIQQRNQYAVVEPLEHVLHLELKAHGAV